MIELTAPRDQYCRCWPGGLQETLIYLHGVQSHSGWLEESGAELSRRGVTVYAPDRRGSGKSASPRGDVRDHREWLEDVRAVVRWVREREPGKRVHLAGLCWGARLALPVALEADLGIRSLVLIAPGLYIRPDYSPATKLALAAAWLFAPKKEFPLPLKDEWFTENPEKLEFIRNDPLALRRVTARFLRETLRLNRAARRALKKTWLPVMLMQSGKDDIVDASKTLRAFEPLRRRGNPVRFYPSWRHTLEFERENGVFYDDLCRWFERVRGLP